jgi:hypothetical protein
MPFTEETPLFRMLLPDFVGRGFGAEGSQVAGDGAGVADTAEYGHHSVKANGGEEVSQIKADHNFLLQMRCRIGDDGSTLAEPMSSGMGRNQVQDACQNGVLNRLETLLGNLQQTMLAPLAGNPAIAVVVAFSWRDLGMETAKVSERFEFGDGDVEKGRQPASCRDAWNGPVMRSGFLAMVGLLIFCNRSSCLVNQLRSSKTLR